MKKPSFRLVGPNKQARVHAAVHVPTCACTHIQVPDIVTSAHVIVDHKTPTCTMRCALSSMLVTPYRSVMKSRMELKLLPPCGCIGVFNGRYGRYH